MACLHGGFAGAELDTAGALALATAQGVQPPVAAALLNEFAAGMVAGLAARKTSGDGAP